MATAILTAPILPDVTLGWSEECRFLIEQAYSYADPSELSMQDILIGASNLASLEWPGEELDSARLIEVIQEAVRFYEDGE